MGIWNQSFKLYQKILYNCHMKFSKVAAIVSSLYVAFSIFIFIKELSCSGWGCGYTLIFPILPWPLLFNAGGVFDSSLGFFVFVVLNTFIIYAIVSSISGLFRRIGNRQ